MYDVKEIAKKLDVCEEQVRRYIRDGSLHVIKGGKGSGYIVSEKDLDDFISKHPKYMSAASPEYAELNFYKTRCEYLEKRLESIRQILGS